MKKLIIFLSFLMFVLFSCGPSASEKEIQYIQQDTLFDKTYVDKDYDGVQDREDTPSLGDINYAINDTMIINQTDQVVLTISNGLTREQVLSQVKYLKERENVVVTEEIRTAPLMLVTLIDPNGENFRIVPITPEKQFLEDGQITFWKWNVTPLNKGNNPLSLSVNIILGDEPKNIQVYEDFIYVYSSDTWWDKFTDFFKNNWQFLLSTLIIPIGIYLYKLIFNKKKKR